MKRKDRGSTLVWAICIIMVLFVTIAAGYAVSYSYYNRSLINNSKRQAYISAKTIISDIVEQIMAKDTAYLALIPDGVTSKTKALTITDLPASMGVIQTASMKVTEMSVKGSEYTLLTIQVSANYDHQIRTIQADLKRDDIDSDWTFLKYYEKDTKENNINITNGTLLYDFNKALTDVALGDPINRDKKIKEYIKEHYPDAWSKMGDVVIGNGGKDWYEWTLSNDRMREFVFYGQFGSWKVFDSNAISTANTEVINFLNKNDGKLTIQVYYPSDLATPIIYAHTSTYISGGGWSGVRMIYDPYGQHWYYLKIDIGITNFSNYAAAGFSNSSEYYKDYIKNTLLDPNVAILVI